MSQDAYKLDPSGLNEDFSEVVSKSVISIIVNRTLEENASVSNNNRNS